MDFFGTDNILSFEFGLSEIEFSVDDAIVGGFLTSWLMAGTMVIDQPNLRTDDPTPVPEDDNSDGSEFGLNDLEFSVDDTIVGDFLTSWLMDGSMVIDPPNLQADDPTRVPEYDNSKGSSKNIR